MLYHGNPDSSLSKSYRNTFWCSSFIEVTEEGMAIAKYCKNRWCPVCQRNKMGLMINTYGPRLERCKELWFVTLTRQNVTADKLKHEVLQYQKLWREIANTSTYRKAMKKKVIGIRKVECTYHGTQYLMEKQWEELPDGKWKLLGEVPALDICGNPKQDPWYNTYHPHLHLLISDRSLAEFIVEEWKRLNPGCSADAQDIRLVKTSGGYLEIFKYFTKLIAKDSSGKRFFDAVHMDVIFRAMQGRRVYFRLGTRDAWGCDEVTEDDEEQAAVIETDATPAFYQWGESDEFFGYYDVNTGETLVELPRKGRLFDIITDSENRYAKEDKKQGSAQDPGNCLA